MIPQKTPKLTLRLVRPGVTAEFEAATFSQFQPRFHQALEATGFGRENMKDLLTSLLVKDGDGWGSIYSIGFAWSEIANQVYAGEDGELNYFPEYDLKIAILRAGDARKWFTSDEAIWLMCQGTYLWARELRGFGYDVAADTFDSISKDVEEETGDYKVKIIRDHEKN